jgi:hypothetical protein
MTAIINVAFITTKYVAQDSKAASKTLYVGFDSVNLYLRSNRKKIGYVATSSNTSVPQKATLGEIETPRRLRAPINTAAVATAQTSKSAERKRMLASSPEHLSR